MNLGTYCCGNWIEKLADDGGQFTYGCISHRERFQIHSSCGQLTASSRSYNFPIKLDPALLYKLWCYDRPSGGCIKNELKWAMAVHCGRKQNQGFNWSNSKRCGCR